MITRYELNCIYFGHLSWAWQKHDNVRIINWWVVPGEVGHHNFFRAETIVPQNYDFLSMLLISKRSLLYIFRHNYTIVNSQSKVSVIVFCLCFLVKTLRSWCIISHYRSTASRTTAPKCRASETSPILLQGTRFNISVHKWISPSPSLSISLSLSN